MLVKLENAAFRRGDAQVLHGIDFSISAREIVTIVGPNGSGKSTLLQGIIGAIALASGRLSRAPGLRIGYVPQRLTIDPNLPLSVARFLRLDRPSPVSGEMAERVGITHLMTRAMAELSGGQLQRVLLARAAQNTPQLLLLDEPTQGLDQPGTAAFYQLIAELRDSLDCAVIMVSHDLHGVMSASDRVVCLNGHICCQGAPAVVSEAPEYRELFGHGSKGALALYQHEHDHDHHGHHSGHAHEETGATQ